MIKVLSAIVLTITCVSAAQQKNESVVNHIGLKLLPGEFFVCRLQKNATIPKWAVTSTPMSITRSEEALSIIAPARVVPRGTNCAKGWRTFEVGFNPPEAFGVVEAFARPLAQERISIHWISSSPTDYLMVEQKNLETATHVLSAAGHEIEREGQSQ